MGTYQLRISEEIFYFTEIIHCKHDVEGLHNQPCSWCHWFDCDCHPYFLDRYVIVGNHRDAWMFGATDASSGTSTMMEMSRVFGELMKEGLLMGYEPQVQCHRMATSLLLSKY